MWGEKERETGKKVESRSTYTRMRPSTVYTSHACMEALVGSPDISNQSRKGHLSMCAALNASRLGAVSDALSVRVTAGP
jgi:hypothetical protein